MLILASKSPRRRALIEHLGIPYEVCSPEASEVLDSPLPPDQTVLVLSERKALSAARFHENDIVLGVDTVVYAKGEILLKPKDKEDAARMLRLLSGDTHQVFSGFTLVRGKQLHRECVCTAVRFAALTEEEILRYISTGEPFDKAGAYGIQGKGSLFVSEIEGDYHSVVGLPIHRIYLALKNEFGVTFQ